ncbi:LYR motif-containing protein 5 [Umbelopsis sp. PMI_123]|nr:LYR motif-containing protein 5 [Umbelopsis sp. PMI_123]
MFIPNQQLRSEVIALYKQLVYLGRDYPAGYTNFFRPKLKAAFMKKRDLVDESEIRKSIAFGDYIVKELEAMYYLKKYRTLRARYTIPEQEAYMAIQKKLESERL